MSGSVGPRLSAHVLAVLPTTAPAPPTLVTVSTLSTLAARYAALDAHDLEWLHLLVGDWQVLSDLAFADLVMWLHTTDGDFVAISQERPSTVSTVHYDDVVGSSALMRNSSTSSSDTASGGAPRFTGRSSSSVREPRV